MDEQPPWKAEESNPRQTFPAYCSVWGGLVVGGAATLGALNQSGNPGNGSGLYLIAASVAFGLVAVATCRR